MVRLLSQRCLSPDYLSKDLSRYDSKTHITHPTPSMGRAINNLHRYWLNDYIRIKLDIDIPPEYPTRLRWNYYNYKNKKQKVKIEKDSHLIYSDKRTFGKLRCTEIDVQAKTGENPVSGLFINLRALPKPNEIYKMIKEKFSNVKETLKNNPDYKLCIYDHQQETNTIRVVPAEKVNDLLNLLESGSYYCAKEMFLSCPPFIGHDKDGHIIVNNEIGREINNSITK